MTMDPMELVQEIKRLKHALAMKRVAIEDLTRDRDFWRSQLDEAQRLNASLRAKLDGAAIQDVF